MMKIEEALKEYNEKVEKELSKRLKRKPTCAERYADTTSRQCAFNAGAKWAIHEFLKDLVHPASEVPINDNGKILAFSKVNSNIKLYDMNAMLNETACDTYQEMWEIRVRAYTFTDWVFVEELLDLIKKGGEQ